MRMSYSRVETWKQCPYKFKLRYIDGLRTFFNGEASNPLTVGTALHTAIEKDVETAIQEYYANYPIVDDLNIEEAIKLEYVAEKARKILPSGDYEVKIEANDFLGFIDLLVDVGEGQYDLYDFKYSNNVDRYMESGQLHIYKWYFEHTNPGKKIRKLIFAFVPKVQIRLKKTETIEGFRIRLRNELDQKEVQLVEVEYNKKKVEEFRADSIDCQISQYFDKNPSRLCDWCEFKEYCQDGDDLKIDWLQTRFEKLGVDNMQLPKNERVAITAMEKKKVWIYGPSFSGKTWLANQFPNPLFLSTDGNYRNLPGGIPPHVDLVDKVWVESRTTKRKFAWNVLKETIEELEKGGNDFETIVLDTTNQAYELCRTCFFAEHGIEHESDAGFGKGFSMVPKVFNDVMARFAALASKYNIVWISHMDMSSEVTKKSGDKVSMIEPANCKRYKTDLASRVDIVVRTTGDNDTYTMSFKNNEFVFGGGRLGVSGIDDMPTSYDNLCSVYDSYNAKLGVKGSVPTPEPVAVETTTVSPVGEVPEKPVMPVRRRRITKEE